MRDYVHTGSWGTKAIKEAGGLVRVNVASSSEGQNFTCIPPVGDWQLTDGAAYCHITSNETIGGVQFHDCPDVGVPLVADMSSEILSRPVEMSRFGLIYAGAQKNIGRRALWWSSCARTLSARRGPELPESSTTPFTRRKAPCTTRRPRSLGISRASCSRG